MAVAEYTAVAAQAVPVGSNVAFTERVVVPCNCRIMHREGSGSISLRGYEKYLVIFTANVSGATAGTALSLALAINGEPVESARANAVSVAADDLNSITIATIVEVPCGCCLSVAIENVGTITTNVQNANIIIKGVETNESIG